MFGYLSFVIFQWSIATVVPKAWAIGIIGYLTIPYLYSIWFETNSLGHLVDALVSWGLVGAWLGWWLPRGENA